MSQCGSSGCWPSPVNMVYSEGCTSGAGYRYRVGSYSTVFAVGRFGVSTFDFLFENGYTYCKKLKVKTRLMKPILVDLVFNDQSARMDFIW
jgi:hypothetical protein